MSINIRQRIGRAIGAQAARDGKSIDKVIAQQVKRGAKDRDTEWMREGYERAKAVA